MLSVFITVLLLFSLSTYTGGFDEDKLREQIESNSIDEVDLSSISAIGKIFDLLPASPFFDQLKRVSIRDLRAMRGLTTDKIEKSFGFAGTVQLDLGSIKPALEMKVIIATKKSGKDVASILVSTPRGWKLKDLIPKFADKKIGNMPMPEMQIVASDFEYVEPEYLLPIEKGVNVVARADLPAISKKLDKFIEVCARVGKSGGLKSGIVFEGYDRLFIHGVISKKVIQSHFSVVIPLRIGVDFEALQKAGVIKKVPIGLRAIMTDDFIAKLESDLSFELGAGMIIRLKSQEDDIALRADVSIGAERADFKAQMKGKLDPAFVEWLALEDIGFEVNFDYGLLPVLAAVGIPFTGLGVRGIMGVGKQEYRTTINIATAIALKSTNIPDLMFDGRVDVISLENFAHLIGDLTDLKVPYESLPKIMLTNAVFKIVPQDTFIANKKYEQGVEIGSAITLGTFKGGINIVIDAEDDYVVGQGFVKEIDLKILKITGFGPDGKKGTGDDGARIKIAFPPKGDDSFFELVGDVEIPPLRLKEKTDIVIKKDAGHAKFEADIFKLFYFDCDLTFNLKKASDFTLKVTGSTRFEKIQSEVKLKLISMYDKIRGKLARLKKTMDKAVSKFGGKIQKEYGRINKKLIELRAESDRLRSRCKVDKVYTLCAKRKVVKGQIIVYEKAYKNFLLKHGESLVKFFPESIGKVADKIAKSERLARIYKSASSLIVGEKGIKSISGIINGVDFEKGKLPYVTVGFYDGDSMIIPLDPVRAISMLSTKYVKEAQEAEIEEEV